MQIFHSFAELSKLPCPVHWAMGFFDGVHLGHKRVIKSARTPGALRGVVTFMPHPLALLRPGSEPQLITPSPDFKAELMRRLNVDVLLVLPFTAELATMSPQRFIDTLCASCRVMGISVGSNWHFGKGGSGNASFLSTTAATCGFRACINEMLRLGNDTVCSSRIRELLAAGDISTANAMLGYNFTICGTVEHGQKLARQLGFPTANISLPHAAALPKAGVYEVQCLYEGRLLRGIANIGQRPTIIENVKQTRLEAHFLHTCIDLYGKPLQVQLTRFIRPEQRFENVMILKKQIEQDVASLMS